MVRWLYSTNAKGIGTLFLIIAVFAAMIGAAFSVLIQMELATPITDFFGDYSRFVSHLKDAMQQIFVSGQLTQTVLVFSVLMFVLCVYYTFLHAKHCYTNVPKILVDMQIAHLGNKLYSWFTIYRLAMLALIGIIHIFFTMYNTGVFSISGELFINLEVIIDSITKFSITPDFFDFSLEKIVPTVYCSEETDSSHYKNLEIVTTNTIQNVGSSSIEINSGALRDIPKLAKDVSVKAIGSELCAAVAEPVGEGVKVLIKKAPTYNELLAVIPATAGLYACIKGGANAPGGPVAKSLTTLGLISAASFGSSLIQNKTAADNFRDFAFGLPKPNTEGDDNSKTNFVIHSPNEEVNTTSFLDFFYEFLVNWMKSHDPNRLPGNTGVTLLDSFPNYQFFTSFNLIVYILFTTGLYFVFFNFTLYSLKYSSNYFRKLKKVSPAGTDVYHKTVGYISWIIRNIITINKVILISLFLIILVCSSCLYIFYFIPFELANDFNTTLKAVFNCSIDVPIEIKILTIPVHLYQKLAQIVIACLFLYYRTYLLINPLKCTKFIKNIIVIFILFFYQTGTRYIMDIVLVDDPTTDSISFIKMSNACNACNQLVFYSLILIIISVTIQYILYSSKKNVFSPHHANLASPRKGAHIVIPTGVFYNTYYLFYSFLIILLKVTTSLAFIAVFHGTLYLFTHYIPLYIA